MTELLTELQVLLIEDPDHKKRSSVSQTSGVPSATAESTTTVAGLERVIRLRQSWFDTRCAPGDYVHLIGEFKYNPGFTTMTPHAPTEIDIEYEEDVALLARNLTQASLTGSPRDASSSQRQGRWECIVDDQQHMIILHPDHLISSTVVADSFGCIRRAVLQDRVKATSEASEAQVYGHILHEIFQEALTANRWDTPWLHALVEEIVRRPHHLEDLYQINAGLDRAVEHLRGKTAAFQAWAEVFVSGEPKVGYDIIKKAH